MCASLQVTLLDADGDGLIDEKEWVDNLSKVAGLAAALSENVNAEGQVANFRTFEQQAAKRKGEVEALEAKETRTEEEETKLAALKKEVASWETFFAEQAAKAPAS